MLARTPPLRAGRCPRPLTRSKTTKNAADAVPVLGDPHDEHHGERGGPVSGGGPVRPFSTVVFHVPTYRIQCSNISNTLIKQGEERNT